ncbi:MAG: alcohol dehydrogenase catalytic domain-containing protein [Deltaproteobacteria bacterium]|nr:alcohol dehydrogenase catalytic domain-containing protein [Deltaproteobacteria bacterium]
MRAYVLEADWDPRPGHRLSPEEVRTRKAIVASRVWRHPRLRVQEVPDPTCGPGEVVVRVRATGICGSDVHCVQVDAGGWMRFSGPVRLPVVLGHEYAGEVVEVGPGVRGLVPGDCVAAEGMLYCGTCEACRRGRPNQCPHLEMVGFSSPGAFAEKVSVHERHCWKVDGLPDRYGDRGLGLEVAALVEPLACAYNGLFVGTSGVPPGSHVAVWGCGPIGLGAILLARAAGAASIVAFDPSLPRLRLATALGADRALDPRDLARLGIAPAEAVREATGGWGADVQVEAAGDAQATLPEIERAFAPGGRMVYLGRTGAEAPVGLDTLVSRGAGIAGSRGHAGGGCFPAVIRLIQHGRIDPSPMITARYGFDAVPEALTRAGALEDGKIVVSQI